MVWLRTRRRRRARADKNPQAQSRNLADLIDLYRQAKVRPLISERYPLARRGEAIQRLVDGVAGKVIAVIGDAAT